MTGTHRRGFDQPPATALTPRLSALTPLPLMGASPYPDPPSSTEPTAAETPPQPPTGPRPGTRPGRPGTGGGGTALAAWSTPRSSPRAHPPQDARPSTVVGGQGRGKAFRAPPSLRLEAGDALPQFSSSAR